MESHSYLSCDSNKSSESEPVSLWDAEFLLCVTGQPSWDTTSVLIMFFLAELPDDPKLLSFQTGLLGTCVSESGFLKGDNSTSDSCTSTSESLTETYGCNWSYMYLSIILACLFDSEGFRPYFLSSFCKQTQPYTGKNRVTPNLHQRQEVNWWNQCNWSCGFHTGPSLRPDQAI